MMLKRHGSELMLNTADEAEYRPAAPDPARIAAHADTAGLAAAVRDSPVCGFCAGGLSPETLWPEGAWPRFVVPNRAG